MFIEWISHYRNLKELKDCLSPESEMVETYEAGGYEYTRVTRSRSYITYPLNS